MDLQALSQFMMNKLSPHPKIRWVCFAALASLYIIKAIMTQTHAVITYCAAVYLLHAFILFATPKDQNIPEIFDTENEDDYKPSNISNDFEPYVRKLPEYSFWLFSLQIVSLAFFLTLFDFTDITVFTPVLVIYFIFIFCMTIYKLLMHSRKYKYNLIFWNKSKYQQ